MRHALLVFIAVEICVNLASCSSFGITQPNISLIDPKFNNASDANVPEAQVVLKHIAVYNQLLAHELGKLPELRDEVSEEDIIALKLITRLFEKYPKQMNDMFFSMYQVGNPDARKYCSPLQAYFWLLIDGYEEYAASVVENYSLSMLLKSTWPDGRSIPPPMLLKIIRGYEDEAYKREIMKEFHELPYDELISYVLLDYQHDKGRFSGEANRLIEQSFQDTQICPRWNDFHTVIDRLNAPELVWFYIDNNIEYKRGRVLTPYEVFKSKKGHCVSTAYFGSLALKRAGYQTFMRHVAWGPWGTWINNRAFDHCGAGIILENGKYFLVVDYQHPLAKPLSGPYDSIYDVDEVLAYGHKITERMWGAKWPPGQ